MPIFNFMPGWAIVFIFYYNNINLTVGRRM
nr:MAG TPA: hypothetical protein [Caudoviricetes sp.]